MGIVQCHVKQFSCVPEQCCILIYAVYLWPKLLASGNNLDFVDNFLFIYFLHLNSPVSREKNRDIMHVLEKLGNLPGNDQIST